jgi:hypothetical protein
MINPRNLYDRDFCIRSVAALVMSLQDGGALAEDVLAALQAAARCEGRLRECAASQGEELRNDLIDKITPENLHPPVGR